MKRLFVIIICLIIPLCFIQPSLASLDSPTEKVVTVRTEMNRGYKSLDTTKVAKMNIRDFLNYVYDIENNNVQSNTDTAAFELGLYFNAWSSLVIKLDVGRDYYSYSMLDIGESAARKFYSKFRSLQASLKLSDEELMDGLGFDVEKGLNLFSNDFSKWDEKIKE